MKHTYTKSLSTTLVMLLISVISINAQNTGEKIPFQGVLYEQGAPVNGSIFKEKDRSIYAIF